MMRSVKRTGLATVAIVLIVAVFAFYFLHGRDSSTHYLTEKVSRGSIVRAVIATGTVNPVTTVQVGSYVSGPIQAIYADFNSPVKAGQLIAKIDPRPFQVKVDEAKAALANARAQLGKDQASLAYQQVTYERDQRLLEANVVSQDTVDSARSTYLQGKAQVALDRANIQQQEANLEDAQVQLNYTNIISPVNGTVVSRNVDVGQTVAASFQTPTLFLIAKDLTKMQVDTNVSESDIGNIHTGDAATFRVDAFPNRDFPGVVGQVRQAPITVQNVVTYDVVVNVSNPELLLKPGMTANVTIVTMRRDDVLRVPMQALRFSPHGIASTALSQSHGRPQAHGRVWLAEADGNIRPISITTGIDDGDFAQVITGDVKVGDSVVVGEVSDGEGAGRPPGSPFFRFPH